MPKIIPPQTVRYIHELRKRHVPVGLVAEIFQIDRATVAAHQGFPASRKALPETIRRINEMREAGVQAHLVAEALGISEKTVFVHQRRKNPKATGKRKLSDEEVSKVRERWRQGTKVIAIAAEFNVAECTIKKYCRDMLGRRFGRKPCVTQSSIPST